jgi:hypothetical protein
MAARRSGAATSDSRVGYLFSGSPQGAALIQRQRSAKPEQNRLWGPERGDRISLELGNAGLKLIGKRR